MEKIKLDDLQLKIMKVLWQDGALSVSQIQEAIKDEEGREFAITTINTILQRLHKKEIVAFRKEGRQYIYRALVSEKDTQTDMTTSLIDKLFQGKSSGLVNHLLESTEFEPGELDRLKQLIEKAQQKKNKDV